MAGRLGVEQSIKRASRLRNPCKPQLCEPLVVLRIWGERDRPQRSAGRQPKRGFEVTRLKSVDSFVQVLVLCCCASGAVTLGGHQPQIARALRQRRMGCGRKLLRRNAPDTCRGHDGTQRQGGCSGEEETGIHRFVWLRRT